METQTKKISSDNGIFPCKQSNEFSCSICTTNIIFKDWKEHEASPRHVGTLERFNLIFTKSTIGIVCKVCGVGLGWDALRTHAYWHKIVPWYEPTNWYKTFFRNHIIEWESQFYCYPCDEFFPEWSTAYIHISNKSHQNLLKKHPPVNDFASWTATVVPYDILVSEAFASSLETATVKCTICNCWNVSLKNVPEHVIGQQHLHKKVDFVQKLRDLKCKKSAQSLNSTEFKKSTEKLNAGHSRNSENEMKYSCEKVACIYIVEQRRNKFSCEICILDFDSRKSVDDHIKETCHTNALKKYGCDQIWLKERDYIYHCTCCDCAVLGIKNVHEHVMGERHKISLSEMRSSSARKEVHINKNVPVKDKVATKPENAIKPDFHLLPDSHIAKLNSREVFCKLCGIIIPSVVNIQNHLFEKDHVYGVKQLVENIVFKEGNNYHCKCCDYKISGLENIYGHISGYRHANSLKALEQQETKAKNKNSNKVETSKQPESITKPGSLISPDSHITKLNSGEKLCNLCNAIISRDVNIQNHLAGKNHVFGVKELAENIVFKEGNNYYCKCCDCKIPGLENVYRHISGYRHAKSLSDAEHHKEEAGNKKSVKIATPKPPETGTEPSSLPNYASLPTDHIEKRNSTESHCKLCDETILGESNVQKHLTGANHVFGAKKLAENIVLKECNNYHCKSCDCMIPGFDNVYGHIKGYKHSISDIEHHKQMAGNKYSVEIATTKPLETRTEPSSLPNYASLSTDHIEKRNSTESHCKLCDETILGESNVQKHLTGTNHVFGTKQLAENIVFKEGNNYHCKCCDCMIPGLDNVYGHIKGYRHAKSLSDTEHHKEEERNKKSDKIATPKPPETDTEPSSLPNYASLPTDHIEKRNSTESHCKLCNETILGESNVHKHLTGGNHLFGAKQLAANIVFKEGNNYHCKCCDYIIPGLDDVYGHIKGYKHAINDIKYHKQMAGNKNSVEIATTKPLETRTEPSSLPNYASLPTDHIEKRNSTESHCKLCDETILGESNVQKHLTGANHVFGAKKLAENIVVKEGNNYHCKCCDCMIPGLDNVYGHINGTRHAKTLNNFGKHKKNASCKDVAEIKIAKQPEEVVKFPNKILSHDHISKLNHMAFRCEICNGKILAASNVDDHIIEKQHVESVKKFSDAITTMKCDKHYCKHCKYIIYDIVNVYTHLQTTRHKIFANKAKEMQKRKDANSFDYLAFDETLEWSMRQWIPKSAILEVNFPPENMPCQFCSVTLLNTSDLHNHLAIHVGAELFPPEESDNFKEMKEYLSVADQKDQNGNLSQLTAKIEDLEQTELLNNDTTNSSSLRSNETTIVANHTDSSNVNSPESNSANCTAKPEKKRRSPRKSTMQRIAQLLNSENDYIHDMRDKLRDTELGMKLCSIKEMKDIYCLICRKEVPETIHNYFNHLSSTDHCEYLEGMEKDHALFELVPGQFSEFDLVCQYMEEVSEDFVRCHVCDTNVDNDDANLKVHINDKSHEQTREKMHLIAKQHFEDIKSLLHCDWYTIHKYWCVPCSEYFESELAFAKHLRSTGHAIVIRKSKNGEKTLIHDFCSPCALLWFGFRTTYAYHCESLTHKRRIWKIDHESQELPKTVKIFLAEMEQYVDCTIKHFDQLSVRERDKEETLIRDLEMAVKSKFSNAKAFPSGSKASGFRTGDSDIEIFLDCDNMYDGVKSSEYETLYLMTSVHQCLRNDLQSWDVNTIFTEFRSSVLKARHKATGLTCEISFENGLAVENMKLIKYFNNIFPPCRKLILFLNQWLALSGLAEPEGISNNALYWHMIFYLQKESSLPSIGSLIARNDHSHLIAGWEVGVSYDFSRNGVESSSLSIGELLIKFFMFYAKFDYRYNVVSPLLGQEVNKRAFADPCSLPKEMAPYIDYLKNSGDPRPFGIDSAMCVQDPLILQRNLTEGVSKAYLSRFRACCLKSLDVLRSFKM